MDFATMEMPAERIHTNVYSVTCLDDVPFDVVYHCRQGKDAWLRLRSRRLRSRNGIPAMCMLLQRNRRYAQSFIRKPPAPTRDAHVCPRKPPDKRLVVGSYVRVHDWRRILSRSNTSLSQKRASPQGFTPFSNRLGSLASISTKDVSSPSSPLAPEAGQSQERLFAASRLFEYLQLESYQNQEIEAVFDRIAPSTDGDSSSSPPSTLTVNQLNLQAFLHERIHEIERLDDQAHGIIDGERADFREERQNFAASEARQVLQLLSAKRGSTNDVALSKEEFVNAVRSKATEIDFRRTLPITASMLLVGSSVGIMSPALPFIVSELGLTSTQFGFTVSAFALSRMLSNVPAAIAVERHGRKPYMTYSLAVVAVATAGVGISGSFEELYLCRFLTGVGVAALATSATMIMTDISTPLNRASTIAPILSAFSAGTAIGPAVGGYLVDSVGLRPTFYVVGLSFLTVASLNRFVLEETKRQPLRFPWQLEQKRTKFSDDSVSGALSNAVGQWTPLLQSPGIRSVMIMNMLYWAALAGSQMTLLPLILTAPDGLAMTATQVGHAYMGMSLVQIFGNPIFAQAADRFGKAPAIVAGCTLISTSMAGLTFCDNQTQLAVALGVWATGSSILSTSPVAYVSDKVTESQRAQALALLRTLGDVGFLVGAMTSGALADWVGSLDTAMQAGAGFLLTGTLWFASRQSFLERLVRSQTKAR